MKTYWCAVIGVDSDLCGEEFFVEADNKKEVSKKVAQYFPGEVVACYGPISEEEAEMMGYDTY